MAYGSLNHAQQTALRPYVRGRVVHDLGAGDLSFSHDLLVHFSASWVVAVDKWIDKRAIHLVHVNVKPVECYFHAYAPPPPYDIIDVAFASWPPNYPDDEGLVRLCHKAQIIAYLGKNTDGSACASPSFFRETLRRELLAYVPDRRNTLLIVGAPLDVPREPTGEERAGLTNQTSPMLGYTEAEVSR